MCVYIAESSVWEPSAAAAELDQRSAVVADRSRTASTLAAVGHPPTTVWNVKYHTKRR